MGIQASDKNAAVQAMEAKPGRHVRDIVRIEDIIRIYGTLQPDAPASTYDHDTVSYAALNARASRVASGLAAEGVRPGDRVAHVDKNGHSVSEILFGARKLGAVQVALNWRLAPPEMAYIINDSEAQVLFVHEELADKVAAIAGEIGTVRKIIVFGSDPVHESFEAWLARQVEIDPGRESGPDEVALMLYTSGTTGRPKGTMLTNANIVSFIRSAADGFGVRNDGVHLICVPLFHVGGLVWSIFSMAQGNHCVGMREFDPDGLIAACPQYRVTHGMMVPAVIQMLLTRPAVRTADFSSLKGITYGGSSIPEKVLLDALATFKCGFYGMYGATELSFGLTMLPPSDHDPESRPELLHSVGKPFPGTSIKMVDPLTLEEIGEQEVGEVWVRSPQRATGYWKRPKESAETFRADGWFRSSDLGYIKDGYLYLNDRLNDMVISGAENIYPAETERVLLEHPDVAEAAAFAIPDETWGEVVAASVVLVNKSSVTPAELIAFVRERLAHYKCPKIINIVDSLPRTASGKIQRFVLREPYWAGRSRRIN